MRILMLVWLGLALFHGQAWGGTLARNGTAQAVIVCDAGASATDGYAAAQLAAWLNQITGGTFEVVTNGAAPRGAIFVGAGAGERRVFGEGALAGLGPEEWVIRTKGDSLLLAGGAPRGTLYAVSRFLQDDCGVRWWTPWAAKIPRQPTLRVGTLAVRGRPAFEYREPFWYSAFDGDWSWRNLYNGQSSRLVANQGGRIDYAGFVHTFYELVPPGQHFAAHPEWYSLVEGRRRSSQAQLCLSNRELRDFLVERVKQRLREHPEARIVSVSQNDCFGACQCSNCAALDGAEGSPAGSVIAFVNYVADKIGPEFPEVAMDTLAYQYTRKPPKTLRPRPNVIVRLCSIECNFRQALDRPANAAFAADVRGWAALTDRLYVWDYTTDFGGYVQPHPNWFALGDDLRFFQTNHVKGIFSEGAYQSYGSEMGELRAWVLAQLMWNPHQDDRKLIHEFLEGYYGPAAKPIESYLKFLWGVADGENLTCGSPVSAKFLSFKNLAVAEGFWREAEGAVVGDEELTIRVRLGHLPVRYVWLARWTALRQECAATGGGWPLSDSRAAVAAEWREVCRGVEGKPWTKVTMINEGGLTPEAFLAGLPVEGAAKQTF